MTAPPSSGRSRSGSRPGAALGDLFARVRRAVLRRRRALAAATAAIAVGAGLVTVRPPDPPTSTLLVAAVDLPAGAVLTEADVRIAHVPGRLVPDGATDVVGSVVGEVLAAPLRRGEALTDARLVGPGMVPADADPGHVAVPIRLSDPGQVDLLDVGDRIDLMATDPAEQVAHTVASAATVLAVPGPGEAGAGALGAGGALGGRLVVLALPSVQVAEVTAAAVASYLTFVWSGT